MQFDEALEFIDGRQRSLHLEVLGTVHNIIVFFYKLFQGYRLRPLEQNIQKTEQHRKLRETYVKELRRRNRSNRGASMEINMKNGRFTNFSIRSGVFKSVVTNFDCQY
jgi:hypothetical protein